MCKFVRLLESFAATWLDFSLFIVLARLNASLILCDFKITASNFKRFQPWHSMHRWTGFALERASQIHHVKTSNTVEYGGFYLNLELRIARKSATRNPYKSTNWRFVARVFSSLVRKLTYLPRLFRWKTTIAVKLLNEFRTWSIISLYGVSRFCELCVYWSSKSTDFYRATNIYARDKTLLINANKLLKYRVIPFYLMTYFLRIYALFF